jgi:branched-chain amino acid transport system ATP-binding protein
MREEAPSPLAALPPIAVTPALELRDLEVGYQRTTILRGTSLEVPSSGVTALLGPNGAGKSTLLRAVAGFLRPTRGSITLFGADVTAWAPHRRFESGLCQVPEGRGVFRSLTVRENILLQAGKASRKEAMDKATAAFPRLGERRDQRVGTLSGGEQQMVAMASAYVRDAKLIMVDEPSLGLAPLIVDQVFDAMRGLAVDGIAMLVVDQFASRALELASTAYVLRQGEISYSGSATDLLQGDVFAHYLGADDAARGRTP